MSCYENLGKESPVPVVDIPGKPPSSGKRDLGLAEGYVSLLETGAIVLIAYLVLTKLK